MLNIPRLHSAVKTNKIAWSQRRTGRRLCTRWRCKQAVREAATICPRPCKLTFHLLTLKVVSESRVTWAIAVPILVFLCLSVLDLGPMYATDRQTSDVRQTSDAHHRLMPPPYGGRGIISAAVLRSGADNQTVCVCARWCSVETVRFQASDCTQQLAAIRHSVPNSI